MWRRLRVADWILRSRAEQSYIVAVLFGLGCTIYRGAQAVRNRPVPADTRHILDEAARIASAGSIQQGWFRALHPSPPQGPLRSIPLVPYYLLPGTQPFSLGAALYYWYTAISFFLFLLLLSLWIRGEYGGQIAASLLSAASLLYAIFGSPLGLVYPLQALRTAAVTVL